MGPLNRGHTQRHQPSIRQHRLLPQASRWKRLAAGLPGQLVTYPVERGESGCDGAQH